PRPRVPVVLRRDAARTPPARNPHTRGQGGRVVPQAGPLVPLGTRAATHGRGTRGPPTQTPHRPRERRRRQRRRAPRGRETQRLRPAANAGRHVGALVPPAAPDQTRTRRRATCRTRGPRRQACGTREALTR